MLKLRRFPRVVTSSVVASAVVATSLTFAAPAAQAIPQPPVNSIGNMQAPERTQISVALPFGLRFGTANQHDSRPGLSMVKLYIGQYVVKHGEPGDIAKVSPMIASSDDNIATQLYQKYPNAIQWAKDTYGLHDTHSASHWGNASTSTYDIVTFIEAVRVSDPVGPVMNGMRGKTAVAADGYPQDYGTATLPVVTGSKLGWSDDRNSFHASASFGPGFSVAAATNGSKEQHNQDVHGAIYGPAAGTLNSPALPGF